MPVGPFVCPVRRLGPAPQASNSGLGTRSHLLTLAARRPGLATPPHRPHLVSASPAPGSSDISALSSGALCLSASPASSPFFSELHSAGGPAEPRGRPDPRGPHPPSRPWLFPRTGPRPPEAASQARGPFQRSICPGVTLTHLGLRAPLGGPSHWSPRCPSAPCGPPQGGWGPGPVPSASRTAPSGRPPPPHPRTPHLRPSAPGPSVRSE